MLTADNWWVIAKLAEHPNARVYVVDAKYKTAAGRTISAASRSSWSATRAAGRSSGTRAGSRRRKGACDEQRASGAQRRRYGVLRAQWLVFLQRLR